MARIVAAQDLYMNAAQDACVTRESGEAAFLLARKGREVPHTRTQHVTKAGNPKKAKKAETKELPAAEDKGDG